MVIRCEKTTMMGWVRRKVEEKKRTEDREKENGGGKNAWKAKLKVCVRVTAGLLISVSLFPLHLFFFFRLCSLFPLRSPFFFSRSQTPNRIAMAEDHG